MNIVEPYARMMGRSPRDGRSKHRLYAVYMGMMRRCYNMCDKKYRNYGGRSIAVCEEWKVDFWSFVKDIDRLIGMHPGFGYSIDRINNDGNYQPSNVRWATSNQQALNRSSNHHVTFKRRTLAITEWANEIGVDRRLLSSRLRSGWSTEEALMIGPGTSKSTDRLITYAGETLNMKCWSRRLGIKYDTLYKRLTKYGWSVERAFTQYKENV